MTQARSSYNHARIAQDARETYPCPDKGDGLGRNTDDVDSVCVDGSASRGYTVPNDRMSRRKTMKNGEKMSKVTKCHGMVGVVLGTLRGFWVNTPFGEAIKKRSVTLKP